MTYFSHHVGLRLAVNPTMQFFFVKNIIADGEAYKLQDFSNI